MRFSFHISAINGKLKLSNVLIIPQATPSGLSTHYLVYPVYTPGSHGITNTVYMYTIHHEVEQHCIAQEPLNVYITHKRNKKSRAEGEYKKRNGRGSDCLLVNGG